MGFLPSKAGTARRNKVRQVAEERRICILYESPHRITRTLRELHELTLEDPTSCGKRDVVVARELTKRHEDIFRGSLAEAADYYQPKEEGKGGGSQPSSTLKGEFTVVLGPVEAEAPPTEEEAQASMADRLTQLMKGEGGMSTSEAVKQVSKALGLPKSKVYKVALELREEWGEKT